MINQFVLGVGSNISPNIHIPLAISRLQEMFFLSARSSILQTKPEGTGLGPFFHNTAILIKTEFKIDEIKEKLNALEKDLGRDRTHSIEGRHTIDLDILVWNGVVTNGEIYQLSFWRHLIQELL